MSIASFFSVDTFWHALYQLHDIMLIYVGAYPLVSGVVLLATSMFYYFRRETKRTELAPHEHPKVSVVIAAFNEEKDVARALDSMCNLNYPNYEIVVVNDGSTDNTLKVLRQYAEAGKIRLINKTVNQGKSLAINDAAMCLNGDIMLVADADSEVDPDILKHLVPHFERPRVGAVAGNPLVKNTRNFLTRMQAVEYISIIGMVRRSQRIWGRIMAVSGVIFAVRKSAFFDVGGFTPNAATEDIDLTWKLQRRFWDCVYESRAISRVKTPVTYGAFLRQRLRWSRGLMYVMHRYFDTIFRWKYRRMWPVFIENVLSTVWAISFVTLTVVWLAAWAMGAGHLHLGANPVPAVWGTTIATVTLILCLVAHWMDRKYIKHVEYNYPYLVYYPIYYWVLLAFVAVAALPALFARPRGKTTWKTER